MSFANLKKNSNIDLLTKELEKSQQSFGDDRIWSCERDKSGNGFAVIRFLPAPDGEDLPFVKLYSHSFKMPDGSWYIQNCPTTYGQKCPVCEANSKLWNSGLESDKIIARNRKRKLNYYSNIYVISDPAHPENEGKVFLYRYGKKIYDKIIEAIKPPTGSGEKPINPFDFWKGANFKIKVKTVGTGNDAYPNYDSSIFAEPNALMEGDDKKLEVIWKQQYKLGEITDVSKFKDYSELEKLFNRSAGTSVPLASSSPAASPDVSFNRSVKTSTEDPPFKADDDEDTLDYFKKLSNE